MSTSSRVACGVLLLAALQWASPAQAQYYDDRTLLWSRGAPPNVLLILDSGTTMVHDPETNSGTFIAAGDDPSSKLYQAKEVLREFALGPANFNMGFSYYEKTALSVKYHNYLYRVKEKIDTDGDGIDDTDQAPMLDGTAPGQVLRLGSSADPNHNSPAVPIFPIRYGQWGDQEFVSYPDPACAQPDLVDRQCTRVTSHILDAAGNPKTAAEPPYYYPAYDWNGLSLGRWVRYGLQGLKDWRTETAPLNGFDLSDPVQLARFHAYVVEDITHRGDPWGLPLGTLSESNQIGSTTLRVEEAVETYQNDSRTWSKQLGTRITELEYVSDFVMYDHPITDGTQLSEASNTLAVLTYQGNADCAGYMEDSDAQDQPVVAIPTDDDPSNRELLASYLGPQTDPVFFFPNAEAGVPYLPADRDHFVPMTETVIAGGRRPIKDSLNEAESYFRGDVFLRDDPLAMCRKNFVILITDGIETCSNQNAPCVAAADLGKKGVAVFVIGFGPQAEVNQNVLRCVAEESGGQFFAASSADELRRKLAEIGLEIERRVNSFSSPVVPSVQHSTDQMAFIATFLPSDGRSIWKGYLHAYLVDPVTGEIPLTVENKPDTSQALWEAGGVLAGTASSSRKMYFGGGTGIPGTRYEFVNSTDASAKDRIRNLINSSLTDDALAQVISFMRGDRPDAVYDGDKLGAIFHPVPTIYGAPSCFTCWMNDLEGYRSCRERHRTRRQVVLFGADDGAFHAFDAGVWDPSAGKYDTGTGTELFAWLPRATMPAFDDLTFGVEHQWTVDGSPTVADIWVDPTVPAGARPDPAEREWRTVTVFGERRGGRSLVSLDLTLPDTLGADNVPTINTNRMPGCAAGGASCEGTWPAFRWEFTDLTDTDGNGYPDLGQTWSQPLVGFIRVLEDGATEPEYRSVAIFGGGWDPYGRSGNFLYILDLETLLKTNVAGMGAGQPAALDLDLNGVFERLYWGTAAGQIWRMNIDSTAQLDASGRITNWTPQILFDAGPAQPTYLEPSLVPITFDAAGQPMVAVLVGSGNRANIFERNAIPNRFYAVLDRNDGRTLTEADLVELTADSAPAEEGVCYLGSDPTVSGWYLVMHTQEKVTTEALVIEGKTIFSTFTPTCATPTRSQRAATSGTTRRWRTGSCCTPAPTAGCTPPRP